MITKQLSAPERGNDQEVSLTSRLNRKETPVVYVFTLRIQ